MLPPSRGSISNPIRPGPAGFHSAGFSSIARPAPAGVPTGPFEADLHSLQETLFRDARDAAVGQQIAVLIVRFDRGQPHRRAAFDAGHLNAGPKARAGRRRSGYRQHRIRSLKRRRNTSDSGHRPPQLCRIPDIIGMRLVGRRSVKAAPFRFEAQYLIQNRPPSHCAQ
jgi:hypothetical protein